MKKLLITLFAALLVGGLCAKTRTIDRPCYGSKNTTLLEINKIELTDTTTVVYFDVFFRPKKWFRFSKKTSIVAGGQELTALRGECGLTLGEKFTMPESGRAMVAIVFPAIDQDVTGIDLSENEGADGYSFTGIDLTGRHIKRIKPGKVKAADLPTALPDSVREYALKVLNRRDKTLSGVLPQPKFAVGQTTLRLHLLNYDPKVTHSVTLEIYSAAPYDIEHYRNLEFDDKGNLTVQFEQYIFGPVKLIGALPDVVCICTNPGDTVDAYLDMQVGWHHLTARNYAFDAIGQTLPPKVYFAGALKEVNYALQEESESLPQLPTYEGSREAYQRILTLSAQAYTDEVLNQYHQWQKSVCADRTLSPLARQLKEMEGRIWVLASFCEYDDYRSKALRAFERNKIELQAVDTTLERRITPAMCQAARPLNLSVPEMLYLPNFYLCYGSLPGYYEEKDFALSDLTDDSEHLFSDLIASHPYLDTANNDGVLSEEGRQALSALHSPFYLQVGEALVARRTQELRDAEVAMQSNKTSKIVPLPQVANDSVLIDSIMAAYRGKIVFCDAWSTNCGWCYSAFETVEPLKDCELKSDDLVFVYIAAENSPKWKWMEVIQGIKGDHYYFSKSQWEAFCARFGGNFVPQYFVVDREGHMERRTDLRDPKKMIKVLQAMLKQGSADNSSTK